MASTDKTSPDTERMLLENILASAAPDPMEEDGPPSITGPSEPAADAPADASDGGHSDEEDKEDDEEEAPAPEAVTEENDVVMTDKMREIMDRIRANPHWSDTVGKFSQRQLRDLAVKQLNCAKRLNTKSTTEEETEPAGTFTRTPPCGHTLTPHGRGRRPAQEAAAAAQARGHLGRCDHRDDLPRGAHQRLVLGHEGARGEPRGRRGTAH